jgi:hypothetical protein
VTSKKKKCWCDDDDDDDYDSDDDVDDDDDDETANFIIFPLFFFSHMLEQFYFLCSKPILLNMTANCSRFCKFK